MSKLGQLRTCLSLNLQCPAGDPVCLDPPARGHHTGLMCGGTLPPWGAAGERSEFNVKPPLRAPLLIFLRGYLLKSFPLVDAPARQRRITLI